MSHFDVNAALRKLAAIRAAMPRVPQAAPAAARETKAFLPASAGAEAVIDFEYEALAESLEAMAAELSAALDEARSNLVSQALEVYYVAEELSRDPAHAHLIPHVEAMRKAYERDFGTLVPERER